MNFHIMIDRCLYKKVSREATFLFLMVISIFCLRAETVTPDFAYPQTVCNNAEVKLKESMNKNDYPSALQYAIQIGISNQLISTDNAPSVIQQYKVLSDTMPSPYGELATLLEAQEYVSIYQTDRWTYNNRVLPLSPAPEDIKAWSRDIFAMKVKELVEKAMANPTAGQQMPIKDIAGILQNWEDGAQTGLSVYDFMTIKSIELLKVFANSNVSEMIPFRNIGELQDEKSTSAESLITALLNNAIEYHESKGEVSIEALFDYLKYQNQSTYNRKAFLRKCVGKYINTPYCAQFILALSEDYEEGDEVEMLVTDSAHSNTLERQNRKVKRAYKLISDYLEKFPGCENKEALTSQLKRLKDERITVSVDSRIYPGMQSEATVESQNAKRFNVLVVKLPESYINKGIKIDELIKYGKVVDAIPLNFIGESPEYYREKIKLKSLNSGVYVLVPSATEKLAGVIRCTQKNISFPTVNVSSLQYFISNGKDGGNNGRIYVTDGKNQKPLSGAKISLTTYRDKKTTTYTTNSEGYATFPAGSYEMTIRYGNNRLDNGIWLGNSYSTSNKEHISGNVLTDLSIYHPGDSIGFVGMNYKQKDRVMSTLPNRELNVYLRDANWQAVDSLRLLTDEYGRVSGKMRIPESGLLGQYSVMVEDVLTNNSLGSAWVEVAEYKSPTFYVTIEGTENGYKIGDKVTIKGKVTTYSGMPVGNADVKFDISYQTLPWLPGGGASFGGTAKTDSDGIYEIELDTEGLRDTRYAFGSYRLNVSATNPAGETQSAMPLYFSFGAAYTISSALPGIIKANGEKAYGVKVNDIVGTPRECTVYYKIQREGEKEIAAKGEFVSPLFKFNYNTLTSGKYDITFSLNPEFKDSDEGRNFVSQIVVYRDEDKCPPFETQLWVPEWEITAPSGAKEVKFRIGSSYSDSWIFMQVADCDKVLERKWVKINGVNDVITVSAPTGNNRIAVTLTGLHDFKLKMETITIIPEVQTEKVEIKTVTFRESITPGAKESWKFKFLMNDKGLADIPISAVMSNQALNALAPFSWNFNPYAGIRYDIKGNIQPFYGNGSAYWNISLSNTKLVSVKEFQMPNWNFYGYGNGIFGGRRYMKNLTVRGSNGVEEVFTTVETTSLKMSAASADAAPTMGMTVKEESADDADAGNGRADEKEDVLREVECPLAFFMPMLKTDEEGAVSVDYTVPQFNGTWQFQIMGYTPEMRGAVAKMNAIASKPVMAQMNAPRFLRTGDVGSVSATIYNNSLDTLEINAKIEIFNPLNGKILNVSNSDMKNVKPAGSGLLTINFAAPSELNYIGIRVYGFADGNSDGEQTIIPIYPSSTPVLESKAFYISPGEKEFTLKVKEAPKDGSQNVTYCDNPIWEVVKALPSLMENESANALSQIYSLYGNLIGEGLVKSYPEIRERIEYFCNPANSGDSALVSNLAKNQNLKTVLLNNTPWVQSAESETLRMQSLIKYTDAAKCKKEIDSQVKKLLALQNADGGWSWCDGMKSSDFVTSRVLLHLGMLKNMGYLPAELSDAALRGVVYADNWWVKDLKEYKGKNYPYVSMLNYLYVRANFKDAKKSSEFAAMEKQALQAIKNQWKKQDIYNKATSAIVLHDNGYEMEARSILESLRQYAKVSKEYGMWYDNLSSSSGGWNKLIGTTQVLEAYNDIEPESPNVDLLRQWLLVSKQTEDWGKNRYMAEVINAVLTTGSKWTAPSSPAEISLKDGLLTIKRSGEGPAWGGVITQYVEPIKDVKSAKCSELSIEKKLYVIDADKESVTASDTPLKVGDKVRVSLTIKCNKDIEYLAVTDSRSACLEPAEQVSGYAMSDGVWMYKEVRNDATNLFIPYLGKGTHMISYDCYVDRSGTYALGIATAQSMYAPEIAAHSSGTVISVFNKD